MADLDNCILDVRHVGVAGGIHITPIRDEEAGDEHLGLCSVRCGVWAGCRSLAQHGGDTPGAGCGSRTSPLSPCFGPSQYGESS